MLPYNLEVVTPNLSYSNASVIECHIDLPLNLHSRNQKEFACTVKLKSYFISGNCNVLYAPGGIKLFFFY